MSGAPIQLTVVLKRPPAAGQPALRAVERAAMSLALRLRDELGGVVTAVGLGHPELETQTHLCEALAAGCDRAVCVWAQETGEDTGQATGQDDKPTLDIDRELALMSAAVSALGGDLIVCSEPGPGDGHGAFAPALAEALGMPHLTAIVAAARGDRPGTVIAEQRGDGRVHRFRCALPVALAVAADLGRGPDAPDPAPVDASRVEHVELTGVAAAAPARLALAADTAPRDPAVIATSAEELVAQLAADRILR